jgi:hypothetical protein
MARVSDVLPDTGSSLELDSAVLEGALTLYSSSGNAELSSLAKEFHGTKVVHLRHRDLDTSRSNHGGSGG